MSRTRYPERSVDRPPSASVRYTAAFGYRARTCASRFVMSDTSRGTPGWLDPNRATQPGAKPDGSLTNCVVVVRTAWLVVVLALKVEAVVVDAVELDL